MCCFYLGRQLNGIHYAMNFLESWQKQQQGQSSQSYISAQDKDVVVIGGGDTGCDCIATSLRHVSDLTFVGLSYHPTYKFIFVFMRNTYSLKKDIFNLVTNNSNFVCLFK